MMTLYHGSFTVVDRPQTALGRRNLDFGQGFYLTSLRQQAERWAKLITAEQAIGQLRYKPVNHQLCIISQSLLDHCLQFVESIPLTSENE